MNIFPIRRRDAALSELKLADAVFLPIGNGEPAAYDPETPADEDRRVAGH